MPRSEVPPIGSSEWRLGTIAPAIQPRDESVVDLEKETEPLGSVSLYNGLLSKLEFVQLKLQNYDEFSSSAWENFAPNRFRDILRSDVKDFLKLGKRRIKQKAVKLTVRRGKRKDACLSIEKGNRRVLFAFNDEAKPVEGELQIRKDSEWEKREELGRDVIPDVDRILERVVNLTFSVDGSGSS